MFWNVKEQKLNLNHMQIDYITFGRGTKNLIMIQGLSTKNIKGSGILLAYMYRMFAKDYKVYVFERRPNLPETITVEEMAGDIAMGMDELGITKADVFGVSQGGMIAQYLAIRRPDLVEKLVLAVTLSKKNDTVQAVVENWVALVEQGKLRQLVEDMAVQMYSDAYVKRYQPFMPILTVLQKPRDTKRFIRLAEACLTCNSYEELEKIKCPVFVIGGKLDQVVGHIASEEMAQKMNCKIYMYEELGHAAYEEAKDFNQKVYDFLLGTLEKLDEADKVGLEDRT